MASPHDAEGRSKSARPDATTEARYQALSRVLRRRQQVRAGLVQLFAVLVALVLGLTLPRISGGATLDTRAVTQLLVGLAAALIPFMGVVFSLLFLVVQFGATNWTPRLNLFRDNPIVWRSFAYLTGVIVWSATAALVTSSRDDVSVVVPITALVSVLAALTVFRALQMEAFRSIQLAPTIAGVVERGRAVIDALYQDRGDDEFGAAVSLPEVTAELRWSGHSGVLRQIDLPTLVAAATRIDGIVELTVPVGSIVSEGGVAALVRGGNAAVEAEAVLSALEVGLERTFDQDPLFAFQLLVDIALRALSPALNDQTTALHAIDAIDSLLTPLAARRLDIGHIRSATGELRVVLPAPDWEAYVQLAIDDIARAGRQNPRITSRLIVLVDNLSEVALPARRAALESRRQQLSEAVSPIPAYESRTVHDYPVPVTIERDPSSKGVCQ
jgi:uncharacterized membrane protein